MTSAAPVAPNVSEVLGFPVVERWPGLDEVVWRRATRPGRLATRDGWAEACLSPSERDVWTATRDPGRRETWLLGRLLAKDLVYRHLIDRVGSTDARELARVEVHSRDGTGRAVRPWATIDGRSQPVRISIAHSHDSVATALAMAPGTEIGLDLTEVGDVSAAVAGLWFTNAERAWCGPPDDPQAARRRALIWSIKEACYKSANAGEQFVPASIQVERKFVGWTVDPGSGTRAGGCHVSVLEDEREIAALVVVERRWGASRD